VEIRVEYFIDAIASEVQKQRFEAIRSFWRIGDAICALRAERPGRGWSKALEGCAKRLGMHPASLDEARRASEAFPPAVREELLARFEQRQASLTPSHVVVLARAVPSSRNRGIEILLQKPLSVRELRSELRTELQSGHGSGGGAAVRRAQSP
jgi:hypothetical protein